MANQYACAGLKQPGASALGPIRYDEQRRRVHCWSNLSVVTEGRTRILAVMTNQENRHLPKLRRISFDSAAQEARGDTYMRTLLIHGARSVLHPTSPLK